MDKVPRTVRWIVSIVLLIFLILTIFRFIFYLHYRPVSYPFPSTAFIMGILLDARVVCVIGLCMLIVCSIPILNPFRNRRAKALWKFLLAAVFLIVLIFYVVDFFHYDYLQQRLNAYVLNYVQDAGISAKMVWQTYPVIPVALVIIGFAALVTMLQKKMFVLFQNMNYKRAKYSWTSYA
ncbi:MAG: hypothetical protein ICV66_03985, partial [Chitinophagaceae bacterium]|nr:hypothetical protein [Chitinophagaceae bacterium]